MVDERSTNTDAQSLEAKDTTESSRRMLAFVVIVAALGGSLFGYDTGIISSALLTIGDEFALGDLGKELVTGSLLVGGIIGALISGGDF